MNQQHDRKWFRNKSNATWYVWGRQDVEGHTTGIDAQEFGTWYANRYLEYDGGRVHFMPSLPDAYRDYVTDVTARILDTMASI